MMKVIRMKCDFIKRSTSFRLPIINMKILQYVVFTIANCTALCCASSVCSYGILENGVDDKDAHRIMERHNEIRLLVASGGIDDQPKGIDLRRMKYSDELAGPAQAMANRCEFKHVEVNGTQWSWVGQNIFMTRSTGFRKGANWDGAIQAWFNENKRYEYGGNFKKGTAHYTQIVWATTDRVGCGYSHFKTVNRKWKYKKLYICNYGPGGNTGHFPYQTGENGSCKNLC